MPAEAGRARVLRSPGAAKRNPGSSKIPGYALRASPGLRNHHSVRDGLHGFTLIEVLIALVIAATALALGFGAVQGSAQRLAQVEERTLAAWAIDNVVNDLTLRAATLEPGRHRYVETMLGRTLVLEAEVSRGEQPPRLVIDVAVKDVATPAVVPDRAHVETLAELAGGTSDATLPR